MQEPRLMRLVAPDGGWGWIVLFSAVMINLLIPGNIQSSGVLNVEFLRVFQASPTEASWMPALCQFLYSSLAPLSSILSMKYSYRSVTLVGTSFAASGMMLSYFANSMTYLYFSYGIMMGIGAGLTFPVTINIVSEYFDRRRGMATGLCSSGSPIGTIILAPFLQYMIDQLGYRLAMLIMGGILLNTLACALTFQPVEQHMKLVPIEVDQPNDQEKQIPDKGAAEKDIGDILSSHRNSIVMSTAGSVTLDPRRASCGSRISLSRKIVNRQHEQSSTVMEISTIDGSLSKASQHPLTPARDNDDDADAPQSLLDLRILRDPLYLLILISNSISAMSNISFMVLLPIYAVSQGYSKESSALLLSIVSLLDLIGRIGGATLSDVNFVPKHYYFVGGLGASGLALVLLPMADGYAYLASFCALFGLSSGLCIGTAAVVLADMLGPEKLIFSYGISMFVNGLLELTGLPLCNVAYERLGSFEPIFMTLGLISICGTALWAAIPAIKRSKKMGEKSESRSVILGTKSPKKQAVRKVPTNCDGFERKKKNIYDVFRQGSIKGSNDYMILE